MDKDNSVLPPGPAGQESSSSTGSDDTVVTETLNQCKGHATEVTPRNRPAPDLKLSKNPKSAVFELGDLYKVKKLMGQGAFGCVVAGEDAVTGVKVAIKKVKSCTSDRTAAKRLLRELRFLRELRGHTNIVSLQDVIVRGSGDGQLDTYIVTDLMEADMEQIIKSSQGLSTEHVRCLTYQIFNGLRHMHRRGIVHRDLKPANLVVDSQCRLKICDFGLSRHMSSNSSVTEALDERFTDYVVTRWYRAPELLLGSQRYTTAVDMWAAGCILGEMIVRKPLFPGSNTSDMIVKLCGKLSPPTPIQLEHLTQDSAATTFVQSIPVRNPFSWVTTYPQADVSSISLMERLLDWTPRSRMCVEQTMAHPFLAALEDSTQQGQAVSESVHSELAHVSQRRLSLSRVTDLILMEAAHARCSDDGHSLQCKGAATRQCACGLAFDSPLALLKHLDSAFEASVAPAVVTGTSPSLPRCIVMGSMDAAAGDNMLVEDASVVM